MTQKTKDLLHAIAVTIAAVICVAGLIPGTIYLAIMNKAFVMGTVIWALIWGLGSFIFGWGALDCWREFKYWHLDKKEK